MKIHNKLCDDEGNMLILDLEYEDKRFTLCTIYGPNKDSPNFYKTMFSNIDKMNNDNYIICGDFNLVQNEILDYQNYKNTKHNINARTYLSSEISNRNITDTFRFLNENKIQYTWRRKNPIQQARLDYFFISETFSPFLQRSTIDLSYRSDHSIIKLTLSLNEIKYGKGLWKFNSSLLKDIDYVTSINKTIDEIKLQYSLPVYNIDQINEINNEDIQFIINDQLFLETLLMEIRGKTISYSSYKSKNRRTLETQLISEIKEIESNLSEINKEKLDQVKNELNIIRMEKLKGNLIRARAQYIDQGEKPTNFFCNLEKHHNANKSIPFIEKEDGTILLNQNQILQETCNFYKCLYAKKENEVDMDIINSFIDTDSKKLSNDQSNLLEGPLTYTEVTTTLKNMKNEKSPGSDGFTAEFFKMFWIKLGQFVLRSLNYSFYIESMSVTQKHGIITCIPKENKPRKYLKNLRPLTLLNITYKLASGSIANRLKCILPTLISEEQTGFVKERFIGENIRFVYDVMKYTEDHNIPGLIMAIDFEKAFDSISFNFI